MLTELLELLSSFLLRVSNEPALLVAALFPMVLLLEMPYIGLVCLGVCRFWLRQQTQQEPEAGYLPKVSCIITCYSEGLDVQRTILSLLDQDYGGVIEILPAIDGARQNANTLHAAQDMMPPVLILSLLYLLLFQSAAVVIFSLLLSYVFYSALTLFMYLLHLLLVSERPREDAGLLWVLPLFPFFAMATRIWSALALGHSLLLRSHLDSSMAPWWVLRKGKF